MGCTASNDSHDQQGVCSSPRVSSSYTGPPLQAWKWSFGIGRDRVFSQLTSCLETASAKLRDESTSEVELEKSLAAVLPLLLRYFKHVVHDSELEATAQLNNAMDQRHCLLWRGECTLVLRELKYLRDVLRMHSKASLTQQSVPSSLATSESFVKLRNFAPKEASGELRLGEAFEYIALALEYYLLYQQASAGSLPTKSPPKSKCILSAICTDGLSGDHKPAPVSPSLFVERNVGMVPLKTNEQAPVVPTLQLWAEEDDNLIQIPRSKRPASSTACSSVSSDSPGRLTISNIPSLSPRTPPRFDQEFHVADVLRERRRHSDSAQYAHKVPHQHHQNGLADQHHHQHQQQQHQKKQSDHHEVRHRSVVILQPSTPTRPIANQSKAIDKDLAKHDGAPDSGNKRWRSRSEGDSRGVTAPRLKSMHSRSSSRSFCKRNSSSSLPGIDLTLQRSCSSQGSTKALFLDREWTNPELTGYDSDETVSDFGFFDIEPAH